MMWTGDETFASSTCWSWDPFPAAVLCEESLAMDFYPFLCAKVSVTLPRATLRSWLILKPFVGIFSIWVNSSVPVTAQLTEQLHGRGSWKSSVGLLGLFSLTQPEKGTFHPSIKGCAAPRLVWVMNLLVSLPKLAKPTHGYQVHTVTLSHLGCLAKWPELLTGDWSLLREMGKWLQRMMKLGRLPHFLCISALRSARTDLGVCMLLFSAPSLSSPS